MNGKFQVYALKELWMWRDNVARTEDEGLNYVLPAHMMMYIAEVDIFLTFSSYRIAIVSILLVCSAKKQQKKNTEGTEIIAMPIATASLKKSDLAYPVVQLGLDLLLDS